METWVPRWEARGAEGGDMEGPSRTLSPAGPAGCRKGPHSPAPSPLSPGEGRGVADGGVASRR